MAVLNTAIMALRADSRVTPEIRKEIDAGSLQLSALELNRQKMEQALRAGDIVAMEECLAEISGD